MIAQFLKRNANKLSTQWMMRIANFWSPFRGAGIKIVDISSDYRYMRVELRLKWFNKNYVGTHFGGSLYAMTDPFYMMMFINNLGSNYIVWDKAATIEFVKPGKGVVSVGFLLSETLLDDVKEKADRLGKYVFDLPVEVVDETGEVVAKVTKTLYVRNKQVKNRD